MRLPLDDGNCDGSLHSASVGVNENNQTFVQQLSASEGFDDDEDNVDYLSLAAGETASDHHETTTASTCVPMSLIDRVVASPEQTYEQLLSSFLYLTAGLCNLSMFS